MLGAVMLTHKYILCHYQCYNKPLRSPAYAATEIRHHCARNTQEGNGPIRLTWINFNPRID